MGKRTYKQHCGLARALDVVGSRWTLLVVRNLLLGPLRFTDLLNTLPGITTNLLTDRLRELEGAGLLERIKTPPPGSVDAYALTERGRALEPAIHELGRWGWPYMAEGSPDDHAYPSWGLLALKRRYVPGQGRATLELTLDETPFVLSIDDDQVEVHRGVRPDADARVRAKWPQMARLLYRGESAASLAAAGSLVTDGAPEAVRIFLRSFDLVE